MADTNVLAELFLPARQTNRVLWWWERDRDWRLPPLWQSEFRHVLLKYMRADLLETTKALAIWQKALGRLAPLEHAVEARKSSLSPYVTSAPATTPSSWCWPSSWAARC